MLFLIIAIIGTIAEWTIVWIVSGITKDWLAMKYEYRGC